jgi:adenylate cyclase
VTEPEVDAWREAGLYDPAAPGAADRLALLRFLVEQGCDVDEMVAAHRDGRLFALSGDRIIRPGTTRLGTAAAAEVLGVAPAFLSRIWRTFGLPDPDVDGLSDEDVEALRMVVAVRDLVGEDAALGLSRVIGASMARVAEAGSSAMRVGYTQIALGASGSEEATARAFASVAALVPGAARLMDAVYRHHVVSARRHTEAVDADIGSLTVRCGVGFADLSGFTTLSRQLELADLSKVLVAFEELASEVVQAGGGWVVKFLGDAVMFVAPGADALVRIARDLVLHPVAASAGVRVRAGCGHGAVLAQDGDYFGTPVNLAARLVDVAAPGELLVSQSVADLLAAVPGAPELGECRPRVLRGFDEPVPTYSLLPERALQAEPDDRSLRG